ncbi:MAG: hypothetical protein ABI866_06820 [Dokdonella sp.]
MHRDAALAEDKPLQASPVKSQTSWYRRLAWLVLGIAILRGLLIVASVPLLAVANNYDQIRVQACLGAYPDRDDAIPPGTESPQAPYERFRFIADVGATCFMTSELLFAWAAWPAMQIEQGLRADHTFSVHWKGGLQFVFWVAVAAWCTRRLIRAQRADLALGHAVVCALVVTDPGNFLYLNTFYGEASAILFCYALVTGILVYLAQVKRPDSALLIAIALAAFFLATSKIQHLMVPLLIWLVVAGCGILMRKPPKALLVALAVGAVAGAGAQAFNMNAASNQSIRSANLIDTLFTAMLPNASDSEGLLAALDLPKECMEQSGKSWYSPGMANRQHCPQVFELHHRDLLMAALLDPRMLVRAIRGAIPFADSWIPSNLGLVEGHTAGQLPSWAPSWNAAIATRVSTLLGVMVGLPLFALVMVLLRRSNDQLAANVTVLSLSVMPLLIFTTSVMGDGYVDLPKHFQLGMACLLAATVIAACLIADHILEGGRDAAN